MGCAGYGGDDIRGRHDSVGRWWEGRKRCGTLERDAGDLYPVTLGYVDA